MGGDAALLGLILAGDELAAQELADGGFRQGVHENKAPRTLEVGQPGAAAVIVKLLRRHLGGSPDEQAALGDIVGKSLPADEVAPAIQRTLDRYLEIRAEGERFIDTVRRVGPDPFRDAIYETLDAANA